MKYTQKFKLKVVRSYVRGDASIGKVSKKYNLPKQSLSRWVRIYKNFGKKGLKNSKRGVKDSPIDPSTEKRLLKLWKEKKRSRYRMRRDLMSRNIFISPWTVDKIYKKNRLISS